MTDEEKIIAPEVQDGEESVEQVLRPQVLDEYIGQESVKDQMNIFIDFFMTCHSWTFILQAPVGLWS